MNWPSNATLIQAEYLLVALIGLLLAFGVRRGHAYWPTTRLLALAIGVRGIFWGVWRLTGDRVINDDTLFEFIHLYLAIQLFLLLWATYLVVRENHLGRAVNLRGRPTKRPRMYGRRWDDE